MRKRRSNQRSNVTHDSVRPSVTVDVRPDSLEQPSPLEVVEDYTTVGADEPEPQSNNPMMVGYVPPTD